MGSKSPSSTVLERFTLQSRSKTIGQTEWSIHRFLEIVPRGNEGREPLGLVQF